MAGNSHTQTLKAFTLLFFVWTSLNHAHPSPTSGDEMVHSNHYDMIMPVDHEPAESMHYQNFDGFFNAAAMENDAMAEMEMDESRVSRAIRKPQALTAKEKFLRKRLEDLDVQRERRVQRSLAKGVTRPRGNVDDWERFDYDILLKHH